MEESETEKRLRRYAAELRDSDDDEITAEHLIDAMKAGAVIATGKHKPMTKDEANEVTPTDSGRKVESEPSPPSKVSPLGIAWLMVRKFPPWGAVIVALAGIAAYVLLRR